MAECDEQSLQIGNLRFKLYSRIGIGNKRANARALNHAAR